MGSAPELGADEAIGAGSGGGRSSSSQPLRQTKKASRGIAATVSTLASAWTGNGVGVTRVGPLVRARGAAAAFAGLRALPLACWRLRALDMRRAPELSKTNARTSDAERAAVSPRLRCEPERSLDDRGALWRPIAMIRSSLLELSLIACAGSQAIASTLCDPRTADCALSDGPERRPRHENAIVRCPSVPCRFAGHYKAPLPSHLRGNRRTWRASSVELNPRRCCSPDTRLVSWSLFVGRAYRPVVHRRRPACCVLDTVWRLVTVARAGQAGMLA